ncbi:MAG: endopeptidase La [Clostridia bacterium]|nr:endopeptidase La [Clostridia bacterium]
MSYVLPLVALRNIVIMPNSTVSFDVLRDFSQKAIDAATNGTREVILVAQMDPGVEKPSFDEVYKVATLCRIKQVVKMPRGVARVMVEGVKRVELFELALNEPYMSVIADDFQEFPEESSAHTVAMARNLKTAFDEYVKYSRVITGDELANRTFKTKSLGELCDCLVGVSNIDFRIKQEMLEIADGYERAEGFITALSYETEILKLQAEIAKMAKERIEQNQRDYFLREEKRVIEEELGDGVENEAEEYRQKVETLNISDEVREKIMKEISRFEKMAGSSADSAVSRNYLDTVLELPWEKKTEENLDIDKIKEILDEDHYGLEKVKERIIEQMAVRKLTEGRQGTLICLAGPPGTGKTSIAKSIASAIGREYVRISLGGVHDEAEIRGHRKTYIGSMPGRIMSGMISAKVKNPLMLLDEIDKMGADIKGDPASAMLEVLDYEQNKNFKDHYIDLPFDLSDVMFIATANDVSRIPRPLLDRMELIEVNGYTNLEKLSIAKDYLIPKQAKENGIFGKKFEITDDALMSICTEYTREAGVRQTERVIASVMRKMARKFADGQRSVKVSKRNIKDYLGKPKYNFDKINEKNEVGIVRGLAWTAVGGDTLSVEVNVMDGSGKTQLTGQLGDVMQESAKTAISYIRSVSDKLGIEKDFYKTKDIHIHVPEGAVPKDGPSAGITMATAVASALTGKAVRRDIAMTGEITLRGKVLEIGGLKEKSTAALRAGINTVIIPDGNRPDIDEMPDEVRSKIKFIPVKDMNAVLSNSLIN